MAATVAPASTSAARRLPVLLLAAIALTAMALAVALVAQHRAFHSYAYDLCFSTQVIWNTSEGRWFETTFLRYNFLGQHIEPVLLLYALLYRLGAGPETLLVSQAVAVAAAALPLFLAARRLLGSPLAALMIATAYLLSPVTQGAALFDFHPETMAAVAVFGTAALLAAGRPGAALACVATLVLFKEEGAVAGAGLAWLFLCCGYRRHALVLLGASLAYVVLVAGLVMTLIRGGAGDLPSRYRYWGGSLPEVISFPFREPGSLLAHLAGPARLRGLLRLLAPLAFLPLLSPAALAVTPLLLLALLSSHPPQHGLQLQYGALPSAVLFVAAVLAIRRLAPRAPAKPAAVLLLASLAGWAWSSPLGPHRFEADRYRQSAHTAAVRRVLAAIPADAPVSAQSGLLPHLSQRRAVWEFPEVRTASLVVVDRQELPAGRARERYAETMAALPALGYCRQQADDGVELWARCGLP